MFSDNYSFSFEERRSNEAQSNLCSKAISHDVIDPDLQLKIHIESLFEPYQAKILYKENNEDLGSNVGLNS